MIAVFGASVTQQKTGYAYVLKQKFNSQIDIFGYGGMHLKDAGICYIDNVIKTKPKYCFVDWFSTGFKGLTQETKDYIDALIYRFSNINCKLIFLFLPHRLHAERVSFYDFCKKHIKKRKSTYLDLNNYLKVSDDLLRDNVHTTNLGAEKYADIIFNFFKENENSILCSKEVEKNIYCDIKKIDINKVFYKELRLKGKAIIVGQLLTVGPHSGIVEVTTGKYQKFIFNTWDEWCYYSRKHFNLTLKIDGKTSIIITNKNFDTSSCKDKKINFSKEKKKLILHSIYFIGNLNVSNSLLLNFREKLTSLKRRLHSKIITLSK